MAQSDGAPKRCAIYTRKSSEKGSSKISIRRTRSAKPAKHTSRVRPARAGDWSKPHLTTAGFPARRWIGLPSKLYSIMSKKNASMWSSSTRSID